MLLKSIEATNFMKYKRLEISDLQDKVFIGIFGENESGKSTIGDVVSFALFGSSVRFSKENLTQLIHWEAESCEVKATFRIADGEEYTVCRYMDQSQDHRALLYKASQSNPIAKGAHTVTQEIENLTRFNFENFRYSFYLAQKEINILKEKKVNMREILHKMLGFDCMEKSCEYLSQELKNLQIRLEKIETEIECNRTIIKNIKADVSLERNLSKQWEEFKKQKKQAQEDFDKNEKELSKYKEMVESHTKMSDSFHVLEIALYYEFYKEKLNQTIQEISTIYGILREEKKVIEKKRKQKLEEAQNIQNQKDLLKRLEKEISDLKFLLDAHRQSIQEKLSLFRFRLEKTKREIFFRKLLIFFLFCSTFFSLGFLLWNFVFAFLEKQNQSFLLSHVFTKILFLFSCATMLWIYKKKQQSDIVSRNLCIEIEQCQKEDQICLSFPSYKLQGLFTPLETIQNEEIQAKIKFLQKEFAEIFEKYSSLEEFKEKLEKEEQKNIESQKNLDQRFSKIENLLKTLEGLVKGLDTNFIPPENKEEYLRNIDDLQKNIYDLLSHSQEYRTGLQTYEARNPIEISKAWDEYEQNRSRFRDIFEMNALGGGTGMFDRLKSALRQKTFEKLSQSIQQEREKFFSTIPTLHELQEKTNDFQRARWIYQEKLTECLPSLKETELKYQKCQEELAYKKDITGKIQSLLRQKQELENIKEVHGLTLQIMKESLESADKRFGPALSRAMSKVLPSFTKGRYQKVQVLDDLSIKVFSTEKNDYVDIYELSGGAMDQLFLSLRLAFSQAIMSVKVGKNWKQFLFFDEPILSFDEKRSDSFIDFLSEYSQNFVQIFMISPRFFPKEFFNLVIETDLENTILIVSGRNTQKMKKELFQDSK